MKGIPAEVARQLFATSELGVLELGFRGLRYHFRSEFAFGAPQLPHRRAFPEKKASVPEDGRGDAEMLPKTVISWTASMIAPLRRHNVSAYHIDISHVMTTAISLPLRITRAKFSSLE